MCRPKPITRNSRGVAITVQAFPSDIPMEGNASAIDDVTDARIIAELQAKLDDGNMWAWCDVRVRVTYRGQIERDAYLGGCSYDSESDFRNDAGKGYFSDLVDEAIGQINAALVVLCGPETSEKGAK